MSLTGPVLQALHDQIQRELQSAYLYLAMSAHFELDALPGCAHWMRQQAREEVSHAMRLYQHVLDRGGTMVLQALDAPPSSFGTPLEIFTIALAHERKVTRFIGELYELAVREGDHAAQSHLQWFVDEQVEEEKTASELVDLFRRAGDHEAAILLLDDRLAHRAGGEGEGA